MSQWVSYTPYRTGAKEEVIAPDALKTALYWAAFAYQLRKDKTFAQKIEKQVLARLSDYAALQNEVLVSLKEALPWLTAAVEAAQPWQVDKKFSAFAQQLDLVEEEVLAEGRQVFAEPVFDWLIEDANALQWLKQACTSWAEALISLEIKALNQSFPDYAPFAIDLKQQLKAPDFTALYVEPEGIEEQLWIACARLPNVRRHLEKHFGKGRQLRTVWALPKRGEIANWLVWQ